MYDRNFIVHIKNIKIKFSEIFNIIRQYKLLQKKTGRIFINNTRARAYTMFSLRERLKFF